MVSSIGNQTPETPFTNILFGSRDLWPLLEHTMEPLKPENRTPTGNVPRADSDSAQVALDITGSGCRSCGKDLPEPTTKSSVVKCSCGYFNPVKEAPVGMYRIGSVTIIFSTTSVQFAFWLCLLVTILHYVSVSHSHPLLPFLVYSSSRFVSQQPIDPSALDLNSSRSQMGSLYLWQGAHSESQLANCNVSDL